MLFLIDEDLPRSTARALRAAGRDAVDVRDVGLRGHADEEVFDYAQKRNAILISGDKGFGNVLRFPPGTHHGIVVLRLPNELPVNELNHMLLTALDHLTEENLQGLLIIVERDRIRVKRPKR